MKATAVIAAELAPSAANDQDHEFARILLAASPTCPRVVREKLPDVIHGLVNLIYAMRLSQERHGTHLSQERPAVSRLEFSTMMRELAGSLEHAAEMLEELLRQNMPHINQTLEGKHDGIISGLGGPEQIERLRIAGKRARRWQQKATGPGKHTLHEALDLPSAEMLCAVTTLRFRQLLRWQRKDVDNARQCAICEQLWLLAGGSPSGSLTRWLAHMSRARGNKKSRTAAVLTTWTAVDGMIEEALGVLQLSPAMIGHK